MAENVGGIEWRVDADTTGAVNSVGAMGKQVDKTESSLKKLDTQTTKTAKAVNKGIGGMGRTAGQAGIQMQQFIGQVQGGQNVMLALSAQAADLGFVLGAPLVGAVVGITASLVGMLLPAIMDSKTGLESVQKAVENVKAAMTLGTDGVVEYTAEMKKLKQISDALTEIKLAGLIAEQNEAFKIGIKETIDLMDEARDRFALGQLFKEGSKEAIASFVGLNEAIEALKLDPTAKSIDNVEQALLGVSRAGINSTKQGRALTMQMGGLIAEYKLGKMSIEALQKALVNTDVVIDKSASKLKSLRELGTRQAAGVIRRGLSPVQQLEQEQEQLLALKAQFAEDSAIYDNALTQNALEQAKLREDAYISSANLILSSTGGMFGQLASVLKKSEGEQSTAYKAMFALSKGFAVAQAGLNFSLALSNAMASGPFPWNLGAMATVAASGASLVGSIASATYSGRENGGSVIGGQTYEVGEKNKPELLMIPGNNGKVMSNAEMKSIAGGNGGGYQAPIINNYVAGNGVSVEHRRDELTKRDVFDIVQGEMANPNSRSRRNLQQNSNVNGVLNGRRRT